MVKGNTVESIIAHYDSVGLPYYEDFNADAPIKWDKDPSFYCKY